MGLTGHRNGLYDLEPFEKEDCEVVIDHVEFYQKDFINKYGKGVIREELAIYE